jgi:Kelch motif
LIEARYGHCQVFVNGVAYAIGGFDHEDIVGLAPSTLSSCESITPPDDRDGTAFVESIGTLNVPRAYAGCCHIGGFIFVFGGLNGYETLSSIEQYNIGGYADTRGMGASSIGNS